MFLPSSTVLHTGVLVDPTLQCVSAWNDNGKDGFVLDPKQLYRTDVFPGLGWYDLFSFQLLALVSDNVVQDVEKRLVERIQAQMAQWFLGRLVS